MTNIRVALRVRPLSQKEIEGNYPVVVAVENHSAFITDIRVPEKPSADSRQRFRQFDFDHTFWFSPSKGPSRNSAGQHEVYNEMGPHLERAILAGYNACLLAYGQSGSGKTHTMIGTREDPGIIPRLCQSLWEKLIVAHPSLSDGQPSFRMEVSFLEIYREKVKDLLNPEKSLKLREHPQLGPHVQGLTRLEVTGEISLLDLLWEGERRRATGNTNSNRRSSRSHAIWTLYLTVHNSTYKATTPMESKNNGTGNEVGCSTTSSTRSSLDSSSSNRTSPGFNGDSAPSPGSKGRIITNQVHLVDLAGSEKADCTTAKSLLAEGADINRSLVALGNVISALAEKAHYVPYRDSALTWLLKDSIGGNASTSIIITASPSSHCHAQTLNSLRFAQRARLVENTPKINLASSTTCLGAGITSPYGFLSVMSAMELKKDISRLAKIIKTAQNIAFQATNWVFGSMLLDYPSLERWRINNGGILRGLAPRANWTRLIHAIEGIGQAEQEQVKLQRERACSEDVTAKAAASTPPLASNAPSTSSLTTACATPADNNNEPKSAPSASKAKSLSDVMVQADRDLELSKRRHPLLNHLRRRNSRQQSESALNTSSSGSIPNHQTSSSTPTHSPTKIVGTEVFIPTSNSFKCLTWQQEETHQVPKPVSSSSHSSLLSIEDGREDDDDDTSSTLHSATSNQQIHQLKYLLEVHYPVTHNIDHASRISERIHGSINDDHYQQKTTLFPTSVKMDPNLARGPKIQGAIPTLVSSQTADHFKESTAPVESKDLLNKAQLKSKSVMVCHHGKEGTDYLFPTKCKHFASVILPESLGVAPFESSDENEFEEPEEYNLDSLPVYRAVHPETCDSFQRKLSGENDEFCCLSAVESTLSQVPTMIISTSCEEDEGELSSSSYEDINMPTVVRPVNLIREFSKVSDPDYQEALDNMVAERDTEPDDDNVFSEGAVAQISLVANEPMDTADTTEILVEEQPQLFLSDLLVNRESVINGVSDSKFRNYFAKELHQMERMGKQIKNLLQLTQRYNVVKPYLDEITNLQNSDHNKEDPEMDKCIERCSGWNVEVELKKVEKEISQLNKVLRTGIGGGDNIGSHNHHHMSTSSNSTVAANESDSSGELDPIYGGTVGYAQRRNIPLLSEGLAAKKRPPLPIPVRTSVSQPCVSSSSSNNASLHSGGGDTSCGKFTPSAYSTPVRAGSGKRVDSQWLHGGTISEDEVFEPPHPNRQMGDLPSTYSTQHQVPHNLSQSQSLQSMETFYRNPVTSCSSSGRNAGPGYSGGRTLQYCPSSENMSVSSSNMTSDSAYLHYDHVHRGKESSSGASSYPLNISLSESPRRFMRSNQESGRSYSKGISESSSNFQPYNNHNHYGNMQNSFNLEEIRGHGQMYEHGGARSRFTLESQARRSSHLRSASDSLDLCSCGDTNSKYSVAGGIEKSSSGYQLSNFGGSTTEPTSDFSSAYPSFSQFSNGGAPSGAFYQPQSRHHQPTHHHSHSKSLSSTGGDSLREYMYHRESGSSISSQDYLHLNRHHNIQSHLYKLPSSSSSTRISNLPHKGHF